VKSACGAAGSQKLDEAYSSLHGQFAVFGCSAAQPDLQVVHSCKGGRPRALVVAVPPSAGPEFNLTSPLDLKGYHQTEADFAGSVSPVCV